MTRQLLIEKGVRICPRGYVLILDADSSKNTGAFGPARLGECVFCSPGTYSINPLYDGSGFKARQTLASSNCLACPAAGTCLGGDKVIVPRIFLTLHLKCISSPMFVCACACVLALAPSDGSLSTLLIHLIFTALCSCYRRSLSRRVIGHFLMDFTF